MLRDAIREGGLDRLDDVLAAIHATSALDASRERAHRYADSARAALGALPASDAREALAVLADYAVDRTK
jgi:octaprenyl-diphosphate synthase